MITLVLEYLGATVVAMVLFAVGVEAGVRDTRREIARRSKARRRPLVFEVDPETYSAGDETVSFRRAR